MTRDLRVPLAFRPPAGWEIGDPDLVGVPDAAFVARSPDDDRGFHPNIVVRDVPFDPGEDLPSMARRGVLELARGENEVEVVDTSAGSTGEVSHHRQLLRVTTTVRGELPDLVQDQVLVDVDDPRTGFRAVVRFDLTVTRARRAELAPVFASFLRSVSAEWAYDPNVRARTTVRR